MGSREEFEVHVVMLALPIPGHVNPMLDLSLKLASKGAKVTFVNSEFNESNVKLPATSHQYQQSIRFLHIPDGLPPEHNRRDVVDLLKSVQDGYGCRFCELLRTQLAHQEPPVTCIVSNTFINDVQQAVQMMGIPYVSFWTQSAASLASVLMVARGYRPPPDSKLDDLIPSGMLPGAPRLQIGELNRFILSYSVEDFMYKFFVDPMQQIAEAGWILMNTFEELETETLAALREREGLKVLPVGPLLPQSFFDGAVDGLVPATGNWVSEDMQCISWLDNQEEGSVIYVSFGSVGSMGKEQLEEFAMGLEASKQAFLWVVRPGLTKEEGLAGVALLPEGFTARTADRGLVILWAPQLRVLRHRAVGGFLTHCGWNSTLEGICGGVPLLCCPFTSDQPTNSRCAVDGWCVGLRMERRSAMPSIVDREEVEKKVVELMQGEKHEMLRAQACQWRAKAVSGSSSSNLQLFIQSFQKKAAS